MTEKNPKITIISDSRRHEAMCEPGETLLSTLQRAGWHIPAPCGGAGRCGKCLVSVSPAEAGGDRHAEEERFTGDDRSLRLACRTYPRADLTVTIAGDVEPPVSADTLAKGGAIEVPTSGRPVVILEQVALDEPSLDDQRSVLRRIRDATDLPTLTIDSTLLRAAGEALADHVDIETIVDTGRMLAVELRPLHAETTRLRVLAVAFDIGTTTVAGYLLDTGVHTVLASRSEANAQSAYGADVISRITAYGTGAPLRDTICRQLARMTEELAREAGIAPESICSAAIVGNTTMVHLLLDLDPTTMSRAPFLPTLTEAVYPTASEIGLPIHARSVVRIPPGVSAYVGTDIVADLLSSRMHRSDGVSLLVDIGTNGEIVCGGKDGLVACSTAAGPAFEGATILHGSGGVAGAINHVRRERERIVVETIKDQPPMSICGTGLMDAVAMLLDDGVVDETGRMDVESLPAEVRALYERCLTEVGDEPAIVLSEGVVLTQGDIRQVQLAKGAIAAGIRVLLEEAGVEPDGLEAVYLAGGFGTYVRPEAAVRVGLLPGIAAGKVVALGNAAGAGAARMLVDDSCTNEAEEIVARCRYVELSGSAAFQNFYMEEMFFPE
ncbi:MAG: ASKHA domain-containing protein [Spirochaetota bacterium]